MLFSFANQKCKLFNLGKFRLIYKPMHRHTKSFKNVNVISLKTQSDLSPNIIYHMLVRLGQPNAFSTALAATQKKQTEQRPHSNESASSCTKSRNNTNNINNINNNNNKNNKHTGTHKSKKFAVNSRINLLTFGSSVAKRKKNMSTNLQHGGTNGDAARAEATSGTSARCIETVSMCQQQMFGRCA